MSELIATAKQDRPLAGIALMLVAFLLFSFIDASAGFRFSVFRRCSWPSCAICRISSFRLRWSARQA